MAGEVAVPGDAVVVRFRPTTADSVRNSALKEYRRAGHYGCSVFADVAHENETEADVIARLLQVAELDGISADTNPRFYVCGSARNLLDQGFVFMKDDDRSDEPAEHYCVNLGDNEPELEAVERFLSQFDRTERRR